MAWQQIMLVYKTKEAMMSHAYYLLRVISSPLHPPKNNCMGGKLIPKSLKLRSINDEVGSGEVENQ